MTLFEQLKALPKVNLHINLTSSISTNLLFDLSNEENIIDLEDKLVPNNNREYRESLNLPLRVLKSHKNIDLAINDLIDRLEKNNIIYTELFLDIPLYKNIDEEKLISYVLEVINSRKANINLVLCLSSTFTKEENLETLALFEKYYQHGVSGIYFDKDKMDNLSDYYYLFDRLAKNNYPYILYLDDKVSSQDKEIYLHASRVIYELVDYDELLINELKDNNVIIEYNISLLKELNNNDNYIGYKLYQDKVIVAPVSLDETTLETDLLNEYCILFNNTDITLLDMVKININVLANLNINQKELLIDELKEKSNELL